MTCPSNIRGQAKLPGEAGRDRFLEEEPDVRALSGARALETGRDVLQSTGFEESLRVLPPVRFVEINREEEAGLVLEHRVDADDKFAAKLVMSGEVISNHIVGDREEALIRALRALDSWFLANASYPLVAADGGVAGFASLSTLEPAWVDIVSAAKQ